MDSSLHELEDHDAATRVVIVVLGGRGRRETLKRKLKMRLLAVAPLPLLLFALANLVDNKRR
jgi:hypothetical protein